MATNNNNMYQNYYNKSYDEVRKLPWQQQLNYFANNPTLYNQEINRVNNVLSQNPNYAAGLRWLNQLKDARNNVLSNYNKYDLSQPQQPSITTTITPKYDNQINQILSTLQQMASQAVQQQPIDVTADPRYQAYQQLMQQNVKDSQKQTMEEMNARGLLMSDMTNDRLAQIEQAGMQNLNAIIPSLYESIANQRYQEQAQQFQNLLSTLGAYQQEAQRNIENQLLLNQQALQERQMLFEQGLAQRNYNLAVDQWIVNNDLAQRQAALQEESQRISNALNLVNTIGYVPDEQTAQLLGVPVGTLSSAAREAAADRALQLKMHNASLAAQERAEKSTYINQLLNIWQLTGKAPSGLEAFGVQPGTPLNQSATEQLQEMVAMQEIANQQQQQAMQEALPDIQSRFGVDQSTAEVIYKVWENPTKESAMADFNNNLKILRDNGIDTTAVQNAINFKFDVDAVAGRVNYPEEQNTATTFWDRLREWFNITPRNTNVSSTAYPISGGDR